jgi:hypothetical protein
VTPLTGAAGPVIIIRIANAVPDVAGFKCGKVKAFCTNLERVMSKTFTNVLARVWVLFIVGTVGDGKL